MTTREIEVECERLPLVPVMVTEKLPVVVAELVVTVKIEELPVAGLRLKLGVAPVGNLLALKVTIPVKPPDGEMFTV